MWKRILSIVCLAVFVWGCGKPIEDKSKENRDIQREKTNQKLDKAAGDE
jgi:PBP1b-binding outer membrane lipoprotein LpoB